MHEDDDEAMLARRRKHWRPSRERSGATTGAYRARTPVEQAEADKTYSEIQEREEALARARAEAKMRRPTTYVTPTRILD